jgi:hypothetical protein
MLVLEGILKLCVCDTVKDTCEFVEAEQSLALFDDHIIDDTYGPEPSL